MAVPASAHNGPTPRFTEIDQVSDQAGKTKFPDPSLVNAWGLALSPTSPLWVANNGTGTATLYAGGLNGAAVTKPPLTVNVPGGPDGSGLQLQHRLLRVRARRLRPRPFHLRHRVR